MKTYTLYNQSQVPALGLGTWKLAEDQAYEIVKLAIELGYRHIDCARIYANETHIGRALSEISAAGQVTRDQLWITSKLWNDCHRAEHVRPALERTLADLQLDYLDLYLIHWPVALVHGIELPESGDDFLSLEQVPLLETWGALEECVRSGLCRNIGVSNFSQTKLSQLVDHGSIKPAMNQIESHPLLQQNPLLAYCQEQGIGFTAYSPLGSADRPERLRKETDPVLIEHSVINRIAQEHQVTAAQVLIAWAIGRGTIAIPKSAHRERLQQNLEASEIQLQPEDMESIAQLDQHYRIIDGSFWEMPGSSYVVGQLWDE